MAEFKGRVLGALQGIYGFLGGTVGTNRMDLDGQVQLVHNVAREAEVASGIGVSIAPGYWMVGAIHTHAGADTQQSAVNPRTTIAAATGFLVPADFDVWWFGAFGHSAAGNITSFNTVAWFPILPGQTAIVPVPLFRGADSSTVGDSAGSGVWVIINSNATPWFVNTGPLLLPSGTILANLSSSSAAASISIVHRLWVGARSVLPPGLA